MIVANTLTIAEAERMIRDLEGRATDTTLHLPTNSRKSMVGGEAAFVQALLTWGQGQNRSRLKTYAVDADDPQLTKLTRHVVGLCATLIADEATDIEGTVVTPVIRERADRRLRDSQGPAPDRASRGAQVEIVAADHLGLPAPRMLYDVIDHQAHLRGRVAFDEVARMLLAQTVPEALARDLDERLEGGLADAIYELFRNTDQYARLDDKGNIPIKSLRGIQARRHAIAPDSLKHIVADSPALAEYCKRLKPVGDKRHLQILEVSVFDAGPGYAPHWLRKPLDQISVAEELEAIVTCFRKHASGTRSSVRGMGLATVVDVLRRGDGFIRIRTGRHSLYADLGREGELPYGEPPNLLAWNDRKLPRVAGTLVTILLPL